MKEFGAVVGVMLLFAWIPGGAAFAQAAGDSHVEIGLEELLEHAEGHAPAMRVARARLSLIRADVGAADPILPANPQLSVTAGPRFGQDEGQDFDLQAGLQQRIEIAGERGLRRAVARRARVRRETELAAVRWETHRQIHATYHLAIVSRRRAAIADQVLAFQQRLAEVAARRVEAGDTSPLVARLADIEVVQSQQDLLARQQEVRSQELRLAELAGWTEPGLRVQADTLHVPNALPSLERLLALAREHQPQLAVRRAAVEEALARRDAASRDGFPEPTLGVRFVREGAPTDGTPEWLLLGTVTLPIPLWQRNQAAVGEAEGRLEVTRAEHEALEVTIETRVRRLASEVLTAATRVRSYASDVLPQFEENLALLRRAFELGEIDFLGLSAARERLLTAQVDAMNAHASYFATLANLEAFLGAHPWSDESHHPSGADQ